LEEDTTSAPPWGSDQEGGARVPPGEHQLDCMPGGGHPERITAEVKGSWSHQGQTALHRQHADSGLRQQIPGLCVQMHVVRVRATDCRRWRGAAGFRPALYRVASNCQTARLRSAWSFQLASPLVTSVQIAST